MSLRSFDHLARPYRFLEHLTFGRALQRARTHFLPVSAPCRSALVLGDGDGRFLAALLRQNPNLHALAVDTSPAMLAALRRRCIPLAPNHLQTCLADARSLALPSTSTFDLIGTHFFLDCLTTADVRSLAEHLLPHLQPDALWLVSDFRIPPRPWPRHLAATLLVRGLYIAFRLITGLRTQRLPDHPSALADAGFRLQARHLSLGGLLTSELWQCPPPASPHPTSHPHVPEP